MQENKRKQQSFEYGAIILLCSTLLVKVIGAVFKIPLSNLIGDLGFGYFSSAYDLFTPIYTLAMAGLPIAISRIVAENMAKERYNDVKKVFKVTSKIFIITGLIATFIMLIFTPKFVASTDSTGKTIYSIYAIVPALLVCCITSAFRGYYEGLRNMYPTAISDIIEALGKLILGYGFAYIVLKTTNSVALSAAGAMFGITIGSVAAAFFLFIRYKTKGDGITKQELDNSPTAQNTSAIVRAVILIAIPVVFASLANSFSSLADAFFVKNHLTKMMADSADTIRNMYHNSIVDYNLNSSTALSNDELPTFLYGIRGKAFTLYNLVPAITSVLGVSALPVLATAWTKKDRALIKRNIESPIKLTAIISMPIGMGFVFMGDEIMNLIYSTTASVEIGGNILRIYGLAAVFAGISIPMTSMLQSVKKELFAFINIAIGAVIKVLVNYFLVSVPSINIQGAAIGTLACFMFVFIAHLITLILSTKVIPNFWKTILKPLVSALFCGLSTIVLDLSSMGKIGTIIEIAVAAVVYLIVLVLLNTFEADDVLSLPKGERIVKLLTKFKIIR
ncbi:MAG: polysaccharide biosynthesis protein [Ruminococcaceae bacterium]|nr:polysaccharide biosynthesis protein [Oscillospiraceae bacterium]